MKRERCTQERTDELCLHHGQFITIYVDNYKSEWGAAAASWSTEDYMVGSLPGWPVELSGDVSERGGDRRGLTMVGRESDGEKKEVGRK